MHDSIGKVVKESTDGFIAMKRVAGYWNRCRVHMLTMVASGCFTQRTMWFYLSMSFAQVDYYVGFIVYSLMEQDGFFPPLVKRKEGEQDASNKEQRMATCVLHKNWAKKIILLSLAWFAYHKITRSTKMIDHMQTILQYNNQLHSKKERRPRPSQVNGSWHIAMSKRLQTKWDYCITFQQNCLILSITNFHRCRVRSSSSSSSSLRVPPVPCICPEDDVPCSLLL